MLGPSLQLLHFPREETEAEATGSDPRLLGRARVRRA